MALLATAVIPLYIVFLFLVLHQLRRSVAAGLLPTQSACATWQNLSLGLILLGAADLLVAFHWRVAAIVAWVTIVGGGLLFFQTRRLIGDRPM
jgi:hypothetical protein